MILVGAQMIGQSHSVDDIQVVSGIILRGGVGLGKIVRLVGQCLLVDHRMFLGAVN